MKKCRFINNRIPGDLSGGGGLSLKVTTMAKCSLIVSHCYFAENRAGFGGAMGLVTQGGTYQLDLYDSVFEQNTALEGGALSSRYTEFQQGRMIYMVNCVYRRNSASKSGGALITGGGKVESAYCLFDNNSVANNQFSEGGGAINISNSSPTFSDCLFSNNKAPLGGAIYSESTTASTTPEFINCTFADNSATVAGGVISTKSSYTPPVAVTNETTLTNCIAWGNSAPLKPFFHSQPNDQTALLNATYSLIQGGYTGIGNISANPFFSNPATGNYQLLASSPAINAGSPDTSFLPSFDLAYQQRIQNGRVDMGAYEFGCIAAPCPPVSAQRIR
ncbi:MAG: hypothetical protein EOO39_20100 [Cytophagaceae bacterium]|nr:MAG: hypothetical protein EOO39_20100 [Cytophagaceae bacterium]